MCVREGPLSALCCLHDADLAAAQGWLLYSVQSHGL